MLTEFQQDLKHMTLNDALTKHDLTLKEAINQITLPRKKKYERKTDKRNQYILKVKDKYYLRKWVNGKTVAFGIYNNLQDARLIRDKCNQKGWIQKNIDDYCKEARVTRHQSSKSKVRYHH